MNRYFSIDSTIFTIISVGLIVLGNSIGLLIWMLLNIIFIVAKSKFPKTQKDSLWGYLIYGSIFGVVFFGFFGFGLVLFGFWVYVLYQIYLA